MNFLNDLQRRPRLLQTEVVAHSPTPSSVSTTAFSKGDGKKPTPHGLDDARQNSSARTLEVLPKAF